jgi:hypothetical protein
MATCDAAAAGAETAQAESEAHAGQPEQRASPCGSRRQKLEAIVRTVEHCRLETHPHFFDHFVEGCQFKPLALTGRVTG